jgi:hypothetical protein
VVVQVKRSPLSVKAMPRVFVLPLTGSMALPSARMRKSVAGSVTGFAKCGPVISNLRPNHGQSRASHPVPGSVH